MKTSSRRARRLISVFERRHGLSLHVRAVRDRHGRGADYAPDDGVIRLGRELRGRAWQEHLYHEMAHALVASYDLSRYRKVFTALRFRLPILGPRRKGFVSTYAALDWEEDFAETFACFVLNGERASGKVVYDGQEISLARDPDLRRKLRAVRDLLHALRSL